MPETGSIHVDNLSFHYGRQRVLRDVSISVGSQEIVGLLGPNGAGKTTLIHLVMGLLRPSSGRISLDGKDITRLASWKRARQGLGYLSQSPSLFNRLSVHENLLMAVEESPRASGVNAIEPLAKRYGLADLLKRKAGSLSGGERRRTELARLMLTEPRFLLLDEPFAGVDPVTVEELQSHIQDLAGEVRGILLTDHNALAALDLCTRVYLIVNGEIMVEGTPDEIKADARAREVYLGSKFGR